MVLLLWRCSHWVVSLRAGSLVWVPRTGKARKRAPFFSPALGRGSPSKQVSLLTGYWLVSVLDFKSIGQGLGPGQGHCVVSLSKTLYSHSASPPRCINGYWKIWTSIPSMGSRNAPSRLMISSDCMDHWSDADFFLLQGCVYLHKSHNTPLLPPKILHNHCLQFLLGHDNVPREI